jgi:hypothetical protein
LTWKSISAAYSGLNVGSSGKPSSGRAVIDVSKGGRLALLCLGSAGGRARTLAEISAEFAHESLRVVFPGHIVG